jgi:hypothetical protein
MKLYLVSLPKINSADEFFTVGNTYEGDFAPTTYDPQTLQTSTRKYYIVKCDIDKWIKVDTHYFITLDEWRERQINKIL